MILFEWDSGKALSNRRKHGITFDNAVRVFGDPYAISEQDRFENGEMRWQIIGLFEGRSHLAVAYAVRQEWPDEVIRIISARKATKKERSLYDQSRQKNL
ncbi:MAG TPA: BrnT family toxin [Acidobacteriaceae bacterium]|jgi:hypothetical protein|nr:BrnT family toxin [Acidobacteriaceae bacterium]